MGGIDGYGVAQQKKRYAVQEARLDCQLQAAKEDNAKLDKLLANLQTSISNNMKRIGELEPRVAELEARLRASGWAPTVTELAVDHSGIVGLAVDPETQLYVAAQDPFVLEAADQVAATIVAAATATS